MILPDVKIVPARAHDGSIPAGDSWPVEGIRVLDVAQVNKLVGLAHR